jgi:hypothetical protein
VLNPPSYAKCGVRGEGQWYQAILPRHRPLGN